MENNGVQLVLSKRNPCQSGDIQAVEAVEAESTDDFYNEITHGLLLLLQLLNCIVTYTS